VVESPVLVKGESPEGMKGTIEEVLNRFGTSQSMARRRYEEFETVPVLTVDRFMKAAYFFEITLHCPPWLIPVFRGATL
jgi:hypothetical protein